MAKTHCKKGGILAWWQDFCGHLWKPSTPVYPLSTWFTSLEHANHMYLFLTLTPSQILITESAWGSESHHLNQIQMEMRVLGSNSSDAADPETCELKRPITHPTQCEQDGSLQYQSLHSLPVSANKLFAVPPASVSHMFLTLGKAKLHFQFPMSGGWKRGDSWYREVKYLATL